MGKTTVEEGAKKPKKVLPVAATTDAAKKKPAAATSGAVAKPKSATKEARQAAAALATRAAQQVTAAAKNKNKAATGKPRKSRKLVVFKTGPAKKYLKQVLGIQSAENEAWDEFERFYVACLNNYRDLGLRMMKVGRAKQLSLAHVIGGAQLDGLAIAGPVPPVLKKKKTPKEGQEQGEQAGEKA